MEKGKRHNEKNLEKITNTTRRFSRNLLSTINPKIGLIGGTVMGGIVYILNSEYGFEQAGIATIKQFGYTFLIGGFFSKQSLDIFSKTKNKYKAIIIPSIGTIISTYAIHTIKGTPQPFISTLPTIILGPLGFYILQRLNNLKNK